MKRVSGGVTYNHVQELRDTCVRMGVDLVRDVQLNYEAKMKFFRAELDHVMVADDESEDGALDMDKVT
ncbi:hypothetical protein, partial [Thioclava electrotropha]|uniref:hypothetical protein n=1 Tax=Thioclava electrotropha TaxID=1549850 RepID=UPI0023A7E552